MTSETIEIASPETASVETANPAQRREAAARGLYRAESERDACGVGFVATLRRLPRLVVVVRDSRPDARVVWRRGDGARTPLSRTRGDRRGSAGRFPYLSRPAGSLSPIRASAHEEPRLGCRIAA